MCGDQRIYNFWRHTGDFPNRREEIEREDEKIYNLHRPSGIISTKKRGERSREERRTEVLI